MVSWLEHVKKVHAAGSTSYQESLKRASKSWKKGGGGSNKGGSLWERDSAGPEASQEEEEVHGL